MLTDFDLAMDALRDLGCDCGTDEPGTCLACVCQRALLHYRTQASRARVHAAKLRRELAQLRIQQRPDPTMDDAALTVNRLAKERDEARAEADRLAAEIAELRKWDGWARHWGVPVYGTSRVTISRSYRHGFEILFDGDPWMYDDPANPCPYHFPTREAAMDALRAAGYLTEEGNA
jgi:hypothetical protein